MIDSLIFEKSSPGRRGASLPVCDVPEADVGSLIPLHMLRQEAPGLPEVSEQDVVRHYTRLSRKNHAVDVGFYPLGSCTMKYNPKVMERVASFPAFTEIHPYQDESTVQGALRLLYELGQYLCEIAGVDAMTFQPAAGAHGEFTGLAIVKAYHEHRGQGKERKKVLIPDSAHGTNPASAALCGYDVVKVPSDERGCVDVKALAELTDESVAALMLTNPNTLGLFEEGILEVARIVHDKGGLLYYDGANANAILGITRPGDMGFDVVHFNLHKTFGTPHGGGGPGAGPVGVKAELAPFLPVPVVAHKDGIYYLDEDRPLSIGKVSTFYGNFNVLVKAYTYIRALGPDGLRKVAEVALLNANYCMERLKEYYHLPYDRRCMHEFVISAKEQKKNGVRALDIAKRLMDFGFHPPTVYFPLIVEEALMIEPTETESAGTLDAFIDAMVQIAKEAEETPEKVLEAPHNTPISRLDETKAARKPDLRWSSNG
jgi:glycine dehydrogenase subunit 2